MPYEYQKLSPQERKEILEERKEQGYPLHSPPHPFRHEGTYLITAANYKHQHILENSERRTQFETLLLQSFLEAGAEVIAWVILTNHYHILLTVEKFVIISDILRYLHGSTSYQWNQEEGLQGKRKVWYRFADRMIRNEKHLQRAMNYIHYNPVKHGLVDDVYDWRWSSLFLYEDEKGTSWLRENWKKYKPSSKFGKGWDD